MDVGFHFNFGLGWEGRGLVSGSLLFVIWGARGGGWGGVGGGLWFYKSFWGGNRLGWLSWEFLGDKFYLRIFFYFLSKFFLNFFFKFFLTFLKIFFLLHFFFCFMVELY